MSDEKRPGLPEAARNGVESHQHAETPVGVHFQKVKPPVVGIEQVTVKCGHAVPFELFDKTNAKSTKGAGISNAYDFQSAWLKLWGVKK